MDNSIKKLIIETTTDKLNINEFEILDIFEYRNYNLTGIKSKYLILMEDSEYQGLVFEIEGKIVNVVCLEKFYNNLNNYNMEYIEIYSNNLSKFNYYGLVFELNRAAILDKYIKESNVIFDEIIKSFDNKTTEDVKNKLTYLFKDGIYLIDILTNGHIVHSGINSNPLFKDINSDFVFNLDVISSKYRQNLNNIIRSCKLLLEKKNKENI